MSEEEQQVITKSAMASAAGFSGSGITERSNEDDIAAAEGSECSGYNFYTTNEQSKVINSSSSSSSQSSSTKIHEHDYIGLASCAEKALGEVSPSENASAVATDLNLGLRLGPAPNTNGNSQQEVDQRFKVGTKRGLSGVPKDQLLFSSSSSSAAVDPWRHDWSNSSFAPYQQPSQTQTKNTAVNNKTTNNERRIRTCAIAAETYDAPSPSSAVVGWPPVQSFRKNTLVTPQQIIKIDSSLVVASAAAALASCALHPPLPPLIPPTSSAPSAAVTCLPTSDGGMSSSLFVKVYMDGVPIGRKVDLDANNSYLKLSSALKDMFSAFFNTWQASATKGKQQQQQQKQQLSYLDGSDAEYVLTYEDRDGDLMLVGDVPWRMFTCTVRRLRIMKSSDAIGLMPEMVRA